MTSWTWLFLLVLNRNLPFRTTIYTFPFTSTRQSVKVVEIGFRWGILSTPPSLHPHPTSGFLCLCRTITIDTILFCITWPHPQPSSLPVFHLPFSPNPPRIRLESRLSSISSGSPLSPCVTASSEENALMIYSAKKISAVLDYMLQLHAIYWYYCRRSVVVVESVLFVLRGSR